MAKDSDKPFKSIFRQVPKWQDLWFYQKTQVLYQMTYVFCERFLPKWGDRTVDQMVQAARAGKQNIVEGTEDGKTSTQMELQLLNVARSSIGELRQDYEDYLAQYKNVIEELPQQMSTRLAAGFRSFGRSMNGFISRDALLIAAETRTSTPVRILRNKESWECTAIRHLYPAGEGAGYAGGIMSSAMDGQNACTAIAAAI